MWFPHTFIEDGRILIFQRGTVIELEQTEKLLHPYLEKDRKIWSLVIVLRKAEVASYGCQKKQLVLWQEDVNVFMMLHKNIPAVEQNLEWGKCRASHSAHL